MSSNVIMQHTLFAHLLISLTSSHQISQTANLKVTPQISSKPLWLHIISAIN